jgi:plasmid stabilization system protein ParE
VGTAVRITRLARAQIEDAARWWRANREAAPDLLEAELERALVLLGARPRAGSPCLDAGFDGVRRLHLERVRYHLYYRFRSGGVEILAFWHTSRGREPTL